jgi:hypothetical protein
MLFCGLFIASSLKFYLLNPELVYEMVRYGTVDHQYRRIFGHENPSPLSVLSPPSPERNSKYSAKKAFPMISHKNLIYKEQPKKLKERGFHIETAMKRRKHLYSRISPDLGLE